MAMVSLSMKLPGTTDYTLHSPVPPGHGAALNGV
jgi:hypothetical protein